MPTLSRTSDRPPLTANNVVGIEHPRLLAVRRRLILGALPAVDPPGPLRRRRHGDPDAGLLLLDLGGGHSVQRGRRRELREALAQHALGLVLRQTFTRLEEELRRGGRCHRAVVAVAAQQVPVRGDRPDLVAGGQDSRGA